MKKRFSILSFMLIVTCLSMFGCAGWTINDDANTQAIAYGAGKGVGALVNKFTPKADAGLSSAWVNMLTANAGADPIAPERIILFYQDSIGLLGQESKDPYGLVSDLTMLLSIYGGSITADGKLVLAQPVPLRVARMFELGYKSGKSSVQNYKVARAVP